MKLEGMREIRMTTSTSRRSSQGGPIPLPKGAA
jgi:hypothetical protein